MVRNTYKVIFENGGMYGEGFDIAIYLVWAKDIDEAIKIARVASYYSILFNSSKIDNLVYIGNDYNRSFVIMQV